MRNFLQLLVLFTSFLTSNVFAQDYYFTDTQIGCNIQVYRDKELEIVNPAPFIDIPLKTKILKYNPNFLGFSIDDQIYIAPKNCLKPRVKTVAKILPPAEKSYAEFEAGYAIVPDKSQVPDDYNNLFPSNDAANPVTWSKASNTKYKANNLFHIGFGTRLKDDRYLAFKARIFKGTKIDTVTLTDINTHTATTDNWLYNDQLINLYMGYKALFIIKHQWKFQLSGFLGISNYTSNLSNGTNNFELKSQIIPVYLLESGLEYRIESQVSIGTNLGYEYLGKRKIEAPTAKNFSSELKYSNFYGSLSVKYYF